MQFRALPFALAIIAFCLAGRAFAQNADGIPYTAQSLNPANPHLARSASVPAQLANEDYVKALARTVYYWGYAAVDQQGRQNMWEMLKEPGLMFGILPGAPMNTTGSLNDYLPPSQRFVVCPNNDTFYGPGFAHLGKEPAVIQTPADVPKGHYWTIQIVDGFSNVIYQLGSASKTPAGKYLLVGPGWKGETPAGFLGVLRSPTNYAGVFGRSFASRTPEGKKQAVAVLDQLGMYPPSRNTAQRHKFDANAAAKNKYFPPGITAEMLAADPDIARPEWVVPSKFWTDLKRVLAENPDVAADDKAMADQARTLVALYESSEHWKSLLDHVALDADAAMKASGLYDQVGVDVGNGWLRQKNGGVWGSDWFGRAMAAKVYIYVNDFHEAIYFIRGTDSKGELLNGKHTYTMTFAKDKLPPVDRSRGGFWSLNMYDRDAFFLADSPNGRSNLGTVSLDANELKFNADGSLTITMSSKKPTDPVALANWLPAPDDQFSLCVRTYVPADALLNGNYKLPNVEKH